MPDQDVRQAIRVLQRHNFEGLSGQELLSFVDSALTALKGQKKQPELENLEATHVTLVYCFNCKKTINYWPSSIEMADKDPYPNFAGTTFESSGSYGCTVFDPTNHERLQIFMCNECLLRTSRHIYHIELRRDAAAHQLPTVRLVFENIIREQASGSDPYQPWGDYVRKHLPERKDI